MKLLVLGATGKTGQLVLAAARACRARRHRAGARSRRGCRRPTASRSSPATRPRPTTSTAAAEGSGCRDLGVVGGGYSVTIERRERRRRRRSSGRDRCRRPSASSCCRPSAPVPSREKCSFLQKIAFGTVMNARLRRQGRSATALLRESDLDCTIVQPVTFSEKPATGTVTLTDLADARPAFDGFPKVSRADVADDARRASPAGTGWSRTTVASPPPDTHARSRRLSLEG